jgi:hypothetical protein
MKISVVYLQYDRNKYPYSFQYITGYLNKIDAEISYVVVDNFNCNKSIEKFGNVRVMGGDNTNWEFSGWQKGFEYTRNNIDSDLIIFCNDSLCSYSHRMLEVEYLEKMLLSAVERKLFIGKVDRVAKVDFDFMNYNLNEWICSNIFAAAPCAFDDVAIDNSIMFDIDLIAGDVDGFLANDSIGINLRKHIYNWLSYYWHGNFNVRSNIELFKNKTKAILNEMLLTAKMRENDYILYNTLDGKIY